MAIDLDNITSGFNVSKINANFQRVENYINDKLLARAATGVAGEAKMERDLDMNGHDLLNAYAGGIPLSEIAEEAANAQEALANGGYGYALVDSFQLGYTIQYRNQALHWSLPSGDGYYYRWDGDLPKVVPPGSTPASTGGIGIGAWLRISEVSLTYVQSNFEHVVTQLNTFSDIATYAPIAGEVVEIDGKQFKAQATKSLNSAVPSIPFSNGLYAIPHLGTVTGQAYRFAEDAYVTNAAFDGTKNYQGLEIDVTAGTIFYTVVTTPGDTIETCTLYEQTFNPTTMVAGAIVKTVTTVPMGHGDYFAVVRNADGTRTILFGKPQTATFGVTKIAKMDWDVANPVSTVTEIIDFTGAQYPARTNITWGKEGKFLIHAVNRNLFECDAADVLAGVFNPITTVDEATITNSACYTIPQQNVKKAPTGDLFYFLSGTNIRRLRNSYLGISDSDGNQIAAQELQRTYADTVTYEPETVTWMWDSTTNKYKTVVGVYDYGAFKITLSSIDSGTKISNATVIGPGFRRLALADALAAAYQGQDFLQQWPGRIGAERGICPGSISIDSTDVAAFNPMLFQIHNFAHGAGNRYGSRIRYGATTSDYAELVIDGTGDTAVGKGIRILGSGLSGAIAHFATDGVTIGTNRQTAIGTAPLAQLNVGSASSRIAIRANASTGLPAYHNASNGPTLTGTTAVALGLYNEGTLTYTELLRATSANYTWNVPAASARWLKEDFDYNYVDGLNFINALKPVAYTWKDSKQRRLGFIADEVPDELAIGRNEEGEASGVWDTAIIAHLVKSVQQLSARVEELEGKLNGNK